jgi:uncharacterized protein (DUF3820 family)
MRVRTNSHTPAAIGTDYTPVIKTKLLVYLPSFYAINLLNIFKRDGFGRTNVGTFLTLNTKVDKGNIRKTEDSNV